jgi:hypothetical protein
MSFVVNFFAGSGSGAPEVKVVKQVEVETTGAAEFIEVIKVQPGLFEELKQKLQKEGSGLKKVPAKQPVPKETPREWKHVLETRGRIMKKFEQQETLEEKVQRLETEQIVMRKELDDLKMKIKFLMMTRSDA